MDAWKFASETCSTLPASAWLHSMYPQWDGVDEWQLASEARPSFSRSNSRECAGRCCLVRVTAYKVDLLGASAQAGAVGAAKCVLQRVCETGLHCPQLRIDHIV